MLGFMEGEYWEYLEYDPRTRLDNKRVKKMTDKFFLIVKILYYFLLLIKIYKTTVNISTGHEWRNLSFMKKYFQIVK